MAGKRTATPPARKPPAKPARVGVAPSPRPPKPRPVPPPATVAPPSAPLARATQSGESVGDPANPLERRVEEPTWLVRVVLLLFLVGFAAFLAREAYNFLHSF